MTTVLVTIGLLAVAAIVVWRFQGLAAAAAAAVLVFPIAWALPSTLEEDARATKRYFRMSHFEAEVRPPFHWPKRTNVPLLVGARRHVPRDAEISFLAGGRWAKTLSEAEARAGYLRSGWARWMAFSLAPRIVVEKPNARWAVLLDQSPAEAGIRPRRAWRFGEDWLVER